MWLAMPWGFMIEPSIISDVLPPGRAQENGHIEPLARKLRDELLRQENSATLWHERVVAESCTKRHSQAMSYSAPGCRPSAQEAGSRGLAALAPSRGSVTGEAEGLA